VNNQQILDNLKAALDQFRIFLDGSYFWYNGEIQSNPWANSIFWASLLVVGALMWRWESSARRRALAVVLLIAAIVVQSAFTVSGIWATHLYILVPFLQIVVALAAIGMFSLSTASRETDAARSDFGGPFTAVRPESRPGKLIRGTLRILSALLVAALFLGDLATTWRYHATLARFGGLGRFSDAIYQLADYLDRNQIAAPAALDWGLEKNLLVLTDGRVQPVEIFGYSAEVPPDFKNMVTAFLCEGCAFINVDQNYAVFPRDEAFRQIVAEAGYVIAASEVFRERSGQATYVVHRVRPTKTTP